MRSFLPAALLLAALMVPAAAADVDVPDTGDVPTPVCVPVQRTDGTTGVACGVTNMTCTQALWGYHSDFLTVGGNNGCSAAILVNPNEEPRFADLPIGDLVALEMEALDCAPITVTGGVECWIRTGLTQDVGVRCAPRAGGVGAFCTLLGFDCYQVVWGIHTQTLVVGGSHTCNAGDWAAV